MGDLTVINTRARGQARELSELCKRAGAKVVEFPVIEFVGLDFRGQLVEALSAQRRPVWLAFTSANGVRSVFSRGEWVRAVLAAGSVKLAAIGEATAQALRELDIEIDFIPRVATGGEFAAELVASQPPGCLCLAVAEQAKTEIEEICCAAGWQVERVPVYRSERAQLTDAEQQQVQESLVDILSRGPRQALTVLLSPLTGVFFRESVQEYFTDVQLQRALLALPVFTIGSNSADRLARQGYRVMPPPSEPTVWTSALIDCLNKSG